MILHFEIQGPVVSEDGKDFFFEKNILHFNPNQHQYGSVLKN